MRPQSFDTMLTLAGGLIVAGLVVQLLTTLWLHALSFILFAAVGGTLTAAGMLMFLCWLATSRH